MKRDWRKARAKVEQEGRCRVCHTGSGLEAAHTIGRKHDDKSGIVNPLDIVPLCREHHLQYDGRRLDLLPYLTYEEQARAVSHVGLVGAYRRLSNERL